MADTYRTYTEIVENISQKLTQDEMDTADNLGYANSVIDDINNKCGTVIPYWTKIDNTEWTVLPGSWTQVMVLGINYYNKQANDEDVPRQHWWKRYQGMLASLYANYEFPSEYQGDNYKGISGVKKMDWTKGLFGKKR